jgi:hypothetical protein
MASAQESRRPRRTDVVGGYTTTSGRDVSELKPPPRGPGPGVKRSEKADADKK